MQCYHELVLILGALTRRTTYSQTLSRSNKIKQKQTHVRHRKGCFHFDSRRSHVWTVEYLGRDHDEQAAAVRDALVETLVEVGVFFEQRIVTSRTVKVDPAGTECWQES